MIDYTEYDSNYIEYNDHPSFTEDDNTDFVEEIEEDDDEISDEELEDDEFDGSEMSLDVEPSHLKSTSNVLHNEYLEGTALKENVHLSHKLAVEKNYEQDNLRDIYDTTSIEYSAMERIVEDAKIDDPAIIEIFKLINNPSLRTSKRKNRSTGVSEETLIEEEFRLTAEFTNDIFETFVKFFTATVDRRKFFYTRFLIQIICNAFDFRMVSLDKSKSEKVDGCNAMIMSNKEDRVECDKFFEMLSEKNKNYIRNNYF